MILDAVTFHSIEMEIAHGIAHGGATMGETMHTMTAAIMSMPVVKKIIVQQSGANQRMQIRCSAAPGNGRIGKCPWQVKR